MFPFVATARGRSRSRRVQGCARVLSCFNLVPRLAIDAFRDARVSAFRRALRPEAYLQLERSGIRTRIRITPAYRMPGFRVPRGKVSMPAGAGR